MELLEREVKKLQKEDEMLVAAEKILEQQQNRVSYNEADEDHEHSGSHDSNQKIPRISHNTEQNTKESKSESPKEVYSLSSDGENSPSNYQYGSFNRYKSIGNIEDVNESDKVNIIERMHELILLSFSIRR